MGDRHHAGVTEPLRRPGPRSLPARCGRGAVQGKRRPRRLTLTPMMASETGELCLAMRTCRHTEQENCSAQVLCSWLLALVTLGPIPPAQIPARPALSRGGETDSCALHPGLLCPPAPLSPGPRGLCPVGGTGRRSEGGRREKVGYLSPVPSLLGGARGWNLAGGGSPPSCGSPRPRSRQPLAAPVPSPGPFGAGKVTASAIASPWEKIPRSPNSLQNPSGCVFHVLLGPDRRDTF